MRHSIALSLAVLVPFAALQASPPTTACPKDSGFAIKEQGVRASLPSAARIVAPPAEKIITGKATSADKAMVSSSCDAPTNISGAAANARAVNPPRDCNDADLTVSGPRVSASQSGQTLRHAINTKGTGTSGRAATDMAINTKGHGGGAGRASPPTGIDQDCDG